MGLIGETIKLYISNTLLSDVELDRISNRLSIARMRNYHGFSMEEWSAIKEEIELEAVYKYGVITPSGTRNKFEDCYTWEPLQDTLFFWFNAGPDTYTITRTFSNTLNLVKKSI
ncbi:MAG: hypothetical protein ACYTBJ_00715 [Planctomycetota bacterium]|jgi:hypothetical protein